MQQFSLYACLLLAAVAHGSASVMFIDATASQYLQQRSGASDMELDRDSLSSVMSALTGLLPPFNSDQETISQLVSPSPSRKPRAYVALSVAGIPQAELSTAFDHRRIEVVSLHGDALGEQAASVAAVATANPDAHVTSVEHQAMQNCKSNCLEEYLAGAAHTFGGSHSGTTPSLMFSSGEQLPLAELANKLFAVEISSVWGGVSDVVHKQSALKSSGSILDQDVQVIEIMLMGLHTLATAHSEDCSEMVAARKAVVNLVANIVRDIDEAFGGDVVYQVAVCEDSVKEDSSAESIMTWKQHAQRHLMTSFPGGIPARSLAQWPPADQEAASKQFTTKAVAYGGFILLLYFTLAGIWCMCNMPMPVDTLLFGSKKND